MKKTPGEERYIWYVLHPARCNPVVCQSRPNCPVQSRDGLNPSCTIPYPLSRPGGSRDISIPRDPSRDNHSVPRKALFSSVFWMAPAFIVFLQNLSLHLLFSCKDQSLRFLFPCFSIPRCPFCTAGVLSRICCTYGPLKSEVFSLTCSTGITVAQVGAGN